MKIQAKHFYTFLAIRRSRTGKIWAVELFPALGQIVYHPHSGRQRSDCESQPTSRRMAPGHLPTLDPSVCSHLSSPDPCAWPMPCPAHLCFLSPILGIVLSLVDAMVWFGSPWGFLLLWVAMGTASNCVSLPAAWPWWGLQGTVAMALLLPPFPCSRLPGASLPIWPVSPCPRAVLWALTKAAALTGLHLPSLVCSPFFLSRSSSSHSLAPLLSKRVPTKVAFASVIRCKGCGHAAVTRLLQHQTWLSVFSTCLPSARGTVSFTASLAIPDQTSLSHFSPGNTCSLLSIISTPESLKAQFCTQTDVPSTSFFLLSYQTGSPLPPVCLWHQRPTLFNTWHGFHWGLLWMKWAQKPCRKIRWKQMFTAL